MADTPRGPGHCDDDAAWAEFVRQYDGQPRSRPDMTDFALANRVFMADRNDLDLIVWQTAAKERIRWLSIELAKAQAALGAQPQTRAWGWDYEICTGCSASLTMADIKVGGQASCCPERRMVTVRDLVDAYDAQRKPPAREDAQPVADEVLPVAWVIRTRGGHIRMWTMSEPRARTAAAAWGMEAKQEGLSPMTHTATDALRAAVAAYLTAVDDLETPLMSPSLGLHRKEVARQARGKLREVLAALQAEQGAK